MAALPLSNQYSFIPTAYSCSKTTPSTSNLLRCVPRRPRFHHRLILPPSQSLPNSRPALCTLNDAALRTSDEDKADSDDVEESTQESSSSSVKSLLQLYKEAVLNGDDKTTSDLEATLSDLENEKNKLLEQIASLSAEMSSGKEKCMRLQADFDNFRKRSEKERLSVRSNAQGEVIEGLLAMVDNFERAKQQLKLETEEEKKIDASYQGIYKQFVEIMRSLGVAAVPTLGKPFDPSVHEAIAREESREFKEGIVIQEFRRGFVLGERLLRPAMVKVSAGPGGAATETSPLESNEQPQAAGGVSRTTLN